MPAVATNTAKGTNRKVSMGKSVDTFFITL